ncbi:hypothetical protein BKA56DRAFT_700192, partial [Ilyonectria sp. MPI-CAGE-AT-0026]
MLNPVTLNGITATEEMKRLKEKNLHRTALQKKTSIVCNYGPIRVQDARIRIAKDDYHRQAAQADEERRVQRKEAVDEVKYIRRWLRTLRSLLRASLSAVRRVDSRGLWSKIERQKLLPSNEDMSKQYALIRELRDKLGVTFEGTAMITWPPDYDRMTVTSAVKFVGLEEKERRAARNLLTLEADGLEITVEDCIEVSQGEFT